MTRKNPKVCSIEGCDRPVYGKGLCRPAYQRAWSAAHPEREKARCAKYRAANPEKEKARRAEYRAGHPDRHTAWVFNLTINQLAALRDAHAGLCQLCGGPETIVDHRSGKVKRLSVDHAHRCCPETGRSCGQCVRGLLCAACNRKLGRHEAGQLITDTAWTAAATAYLARFESGEVRVLLERTA